MQDNTVAADNSVFPANLEFAENFNVAVPFVDRHLEEGRGEKVIIHVHGGGVVTYATLAEHVNKAGNAFINLGVTPGDRILMVIKDAPEFFYTCRGAIKVGIVPVPLNTLLRAKDYTYMVDDSEAAGVIYSPEFRNEVEPALQGARHSPHIVLPTEGNCDTFA